MIRYIKTVSRRAQGRISASVWAATNKPFVLCILQTAFMGTRVSYNISCGEGVGLGWWRYQQLTCSKSNRFKASQWWKKSFKKILKVTLCQEGPMGWEKAQKNPQHVGDAEIPDFCSKEKGALLPCQHYASLQHCRGSDLVAPEIF